MDTVSNVVTMLKELGTPAVMVIGFAWVIFKLNVFKTEFKADNAVLRYEFKADISELRTEFKADILELRADVSGLKADVSELKSDVAVLKTDVAELKSDVKSIKNNHLPHIEAAINELSKGTPNEEHVKAILDLSHKADL
jgi:peptidoglycan hydrolase CwlO-like protein